MKLVSVFLLQLALVDKDFKEQNNNTKLQRLKYKEFFNSSEKYSL